MSPRPYNRTLRMAAADEAKRRIVEAAAELHATHGGVGTSHAMIAKKAGVSIPTVYKYFPTGDALIPACTGLVASRAPVALDERLFDGHSRVADRVRILARALFQLHEYLSPWLRWTPIDAAAFPSLRAFLEESRRGREHLIRMALHPPRSPAPTSSARLLAEVLLDLPSWRALTSGGQTTERAAMVAADAVLRVIHDRG